MPSAKCYGCGPVTMQAQPGEAVLLARVRAAARAEIESFTAALAASSLAAPKCAALLRAWHALALLDVILEGSTPQDAAPFASAVASGDRSALPPGLRELNADFAIAVARCAESRPGADVAVPGTRELEDHRRVLLRTYAALNRRVRPRLPPRRLPWRRIAATAVAVALVATALLVIYRPRWRASYYPNVSFTGKPKYIGRLLQPDRNFDHVGPGHGLPNDHFSVRYETCLVLAKPVTVLFTVGADDGGALYVDDKKVVDVWGDHPYTKASGSSALEAGKHALRLDYFQGGGDARITFDGRVGPTGPDITGMLHLPSVDGPVCK
jgi:PA14 domain